MDETGSLIWRLAKWFADSHTDPSEFFTRLDSNHNGSLDEDELGFLLTQVDKNLTPAQLRQAFNEFDKDRNGNIEKGEFLSRLEKAHPQPLPFRCDFPIGTEVEYNSLSSGGWTPAKVVAFHADKNVYDLNNKSDVPREKLQARRPLPLGWETAVDPSSGNQFYYNREANVSRWDYPPAALGGGFPAPPPARGLSPVRVAAESRVISPVRADSPVRWRSSPNLGASPVRETATQVPKVKIEGRAILKDASLELGRVRTSFHGGSAFNDDFVCDPDLNASVDWRGARAVPREDPDYLIASAIVDAAFRMARDTRTEQDVSDTQWFTSGALAQLLDTPSVQDQETRIVSLANRCQQIVSQEPVLARVPAPAKIFGDVHGQLRDLLMLLDAYGFPSHRGGDIEATAYVFNGDWVDRGKHQLEVVVFVFALKVLYPSRVFLVRGNHEFRSQNESHGDYYGFREQCKQVFVGSSVPAHSLVGSPRGAQSSNSGAAAYEACHRAFEWLPLVALVESAILVLHGGLGDGAWNINELEHRVPRPLAELGRGEPAFIEQILWSDPSDSDCEMRRGVAKNYSRGDPSSHNIIEFGKEITQQFCKRNGVQLVVRSHQFVKEGVKFMHSGRLITLFSARNYFDREQNDGALLLVARDEEGNLLVRTKRLAHANQWPNSPRG